MGIKNNDPEAFLRKGALAVAIIEALEFITAAKKSGVDPVSGVDQAIDLFESVLHESGFEVVLCPAQDMGQAFEGFTNRLKRVGVIDGKPTGNLPVGDLPN